MAVGSKAEMSFEEMQAVADRVVGDTARLIRALDSLDVRGAGRRNNIHPALMGGLMDVLRATQNANYLRTVWLNTVDGLVSDRGTEKVFIDLFNLRGRAARETDERAAERQAAPGQATAEQAVKE